MSAPHALRILIAEDYPDIADSMTFILAAQGHHVQVARDGMEAVSSAASLRPDVILLDIGMPKLDGYTAAVQIRELLGSDVFLVAMTAWTREEDKQRAKVAGFDRHIAKPPDIAALLEMLNAVGARR
jgi:CheY-like chemotaxis protein